MESAKYKKCKLCAGLRSGYTITIILAISLGLLSIISAALYLSSTTQLKIQTYPQLDQEGILIASLAVASAVGAVASLIANLAIKEQMLVRSETVTQVPKFAGIEYPYEVLRIAYEGLIWPVFAQDARPIKGEPLLAPSPMCPLCDAVLTDSNFALTASNVLSWKCVSCKFAVTKKESIEDTSGRVRQIAYGKLREQRKERRRLLVGLDSFLTSNQSDAA